jgi:hypothetical protein
MRAIVLLLLARAALCQAPADVKDCRPCTFSPGPGLPPYHFVFNVKSNAEGRGIDEIRVLRESETEPRQRLPVKDMTPISEQESFFFGGLDLNMDGFLDLMLITDRGVANAYADYWLFDSASGNYVYLGKYPVFRIDSKRHRLLTYERGGSAGLIYESREYEFQGNKLILVKSEKQDAAGRRGAYRKVARERVNGVMKITRAETVKAP